VRKLEFALGQAIARKASAVLTFGAIGSHHALATSVYARRCGLRSIVVMAPQPLTAHVRNNLLLQQYYGAQLHLFDSFGDFPQGVKQIIRQEVASTGVEPFVIPPGGSSVEGALGYVNGAFELAAQIHAGRMVAPRSLYVPLGTAGTAVGLMVGLRAAGLAVDLQLVRVVEGSFASPQRCVQLATEVVELLSRYEPSFASQHFSERDFVIRDEFFGAGYGESTPGGVEAVELMQRTEGITLETTYSAKACAALIADVRSGRIGNAPALFWNTYNAIPLSTSAAAVDYTLLPQPFHRFFSSDLAQAR
jgi:D-cysteine desulfhydrase